MNTQFFFVENPTPYTKAEKTSQRHDRVLFVRNMRDFVRRKRTRQNACTKLSIFCTEGKCEEKPTHISIGGDESETRSSFLRTKYWGFRTKKKNETKRLYETLHILYRRKMRENTKLNLICIYCISIVICFLFPHLSQKLNIIYRNKYRVYRFLDRT